MITRAIVLAGGLGTRLRSVVADRPKPMAEVAGKPFLEYILIELAKSTVEEVRLSVGYKWEMVKEHFGHEFQGLRLEYIVEEEPLGTGGGIRLAMEGWDEAYVLNGDTFFDFNISELGDFYQASGADIAIALKHMSNFDRYGTVALEGDRITAFKEKQQMAEGEINAGVYALKSTVFGNRAAGSKFSMEADVFEAEIDSLKICGKTFDGYFIDIGIPEDYEKANAYFS